MKDPYENVIPCEGCGADIDIGAPDGCCRACRLEAQQEQEHDYDD
jgi:hypothetical protein